MRFKRIKSISKAKNEQLLYNISFGYEKISNKRLNPKNYN